MMKVTLFEIFSVLSIVFVTCFIIKELCTPNHGKLIIKADENKGLPTLMILLLMPCFILLLLNTKDYMQYKYNYNLNGILSSIILIEILIVKLIRAFRDSEIRQNGIYNDIHFYKWSRIQNYSWTSGNTIQFEVSTVFNTSKSVTFTVKEDLKSKVDDVIQNYIKS